MSEQTFIAAYVGLVVAWGVMMGVLEWWYFHHNDTPR